MAKLEVSREVRSKIIVEELHKFRDIARRYRKLLTAIGKL